MVVDLAFSLLRSRQSTRSRQSNFSETQKIYVKCPPLSHLSSLKKGNREMMREIFARRPKGRGKCGRSGGRG